MASDPDVEKILKAALEAALEHISSFTSSSSSSAEIAKVAETVLKAAQVAEVEVADAEVAEALDFLRLEVRRKRVRADVLGRCPQAVLESWATARRGDLRVWEARRAMMMKWEWQAREQWGASPPRVLVEAMAAKELMEANSSAEVVNPESLPSKKRARM